MRGSRAPSVIAVATFVTVALIATLALGNVVYANSCAAGWTGYVPLGSCAKTFWSTAFLIGPAVGLFAGATAALLTRRTVRRRSEAS